MISSSTCCYWAVHCIGRNNIIIFLTKPSSYCISLCFWYVYWVVFIFLRRLFRKDVGFFCVMSIYLFAGVFLLTQLIVYYMCVCVWVVMSHVCVHYYMLTMSRQHFGTDVKASAWHFLVVQTMQSGTASKSKWEIPKLNFARPKYTFVYPCRNL